MPCACPAWQIYADSNRATTRDRPYPSTAGRASVLGYVPWVRLGIPATMVTVGGYLGFMAISAMVSYSLFLLPQVLSFWLVNTSASS
jgi:hypothetical protein